MTRYLFLLCLLVIWNNTVAQSRLDALLAIDPILGEALDSFRAGKPQLAIELLNREKLRFKQEQRWMKYGAALIMKGKICAESKQLDSALVALKEALQVAKQIGNERVAANTEEGLSRLYMAMHQYPAAYQHYRNFAQWCLQDGKPRAKVETCLQLSQIYIRRMESDSIKKYVRKGLSLSKGQDFPLLVFKINQFAGLCWNNWNRPDSALYYFYQNVAGLRIHPSPERAVFVNLCIAHVFLDNANPVRARKYWAIARQNFSKSPAAFSKALLSYYDGLILTREKKESEAIQTLERSLQAFKALPKPHRHKTMQARCMNALAELYHRKGENEKALQLLQQAKSMDLVVFEHLNEMQSELLEAAILSDQAAIRASDELLMNNLIWAKKSANLNYQLKLYQTLADNERKKKNYEKAIVYLDKVRALEEKLDPVLRASLLHNSEAKWENAQHQDTIGQLKQLNQRNSRKIASSQKSILYLLGALIGLSMLGAAVYSVKRRQQQRLLAEKQQVEAALQEKELLLKEIHHRVKNNMQVISSLLNLQARSVQDPVALKVMKEGRDRVRSMALIHQTLYQNNDYSSVETEDYLLKLAENLFHTYNIDQSRVQLIAQIEPIKFNVDIMIALGLILNELISNTLKYAFPDEQAGQVHISLATRSNQVELKVEDNGIGFPPSFAPEQSRSIGFSLIQAFTQKLGGTLQVQNAEKGARASLIFPLTNPNIAA